MTSALQMPGYDVAKYQSVKVEESLWAEIAQLAAYHRKKIAAYHASLLRPIVRQEMLKMHAEQGARLAQRPNDEDEPPTRPRRRS